MLLALLLLLATPSNAQVNNTLDNKEENISLIDDTPDQETAKKHLLNEQSSVISKISNLTELQKSKIARIEYSRNKKLDKINKCIEKNKKLLRSFMQNAENNIQKIEKTKAKITQLTIRKQELREKTQLKIKKILTADQQKLL